MNELLARTVCHDIRYLVISYFNGDIDLPFLNPSPLKEKENLDNGWNDKIIRKDI